MTKNTGNKISLENRFYKIIQYTVAVLVFCVLIVYIIGQVILKNPPIFNAVCEEYTGSWVHVDSKGNTETLTAPATINVSGEENVRIYTILPDEIPEGYSLFIKTGRDFTVYVEGTERASYKIEKSVFGITAKSMWLPIKLYTDDAGKKLEIVRDGKSYDTLLISPFFIGNDLGFFHMLLQSNIFILLLSFSLFIFGFVIVIVCIIYRVRSKKSFALMYLSIAVFAASTWLILDNFAYPYLFENYFIDGVTEFMVSMLLPFPFTSYLNVLQKRRYQKLFNIVNSIIILEFVILTTLHFTNIFDFNSAILIINLITIIIIVFTLLLMCYDVFVKKNKEYKIIAVGFFIFIIFSLTEVIHLCIPEHSNDGICIATGLICLLVLATYHEILGISDLRVKTLEAQSSNEAKSVFLANMSHEIRTPINAVMGMNELILREDTSDTVHEYAKNVKDASNTLLEIVNDILDFSKIEQGKMELIEEKYDIAELLIGVLNMMSVKSNEKGLKLVSEVSKSIPRKLIGDSKRIREIIINLLNNSVKYTKKGEVSLDVRMNKNQDPPVLIVSVKDTGIGIRDEDRDKLFKQFERLDYTKNKNIEGTGLGLAITAGFIRLMGGDITCNSTYGKGSEFIARIPQQIADDTPIGDLDDVRAELLSKKASKPKGFKCPEASILVVDDNAMNLKVASRFIGLTDAEVVCCDSGKAMLELINEEHFDVILLDHMMPVMDGIETLKKARSMTDSLNKGTPVIALTANAILGAEEMYLANGFTDYLSKPMNIDALNRMLLKYLPPEKVISKE